MAENLEKSKKEIYEEEKAKRLALKEKELKAAQKKQRKESKEYKNPVNTLIGKILVITLSVAMLFGIVAGVIYALVEASGK